MPRDKELTMKIFAQTRPTHIARSGCREAAMAPLRGLGHRRAACRIGPFRPQTAPEPGLPAALPESVGVDSTPLIRMSEWIPQGQYWICAQLPRGQGREADFRALRRRS